jgi:hypothetical protein
VADDSVAMAPPDERAIAHVAGLADGGPADPAWRVTLHFHPDRLAAGGPAQVRCDASRSGRYDEQSLKRVWHYLARFGSPEMRR